MNIRERKRGKGRNGIDDAFISSSLYTPKRRRIDRITMSTRSAEVNTEIELEFEDQDFLGECEMCGVYLYKNDYWCPACEYGRRDPLIPKWRYVQGLKTVTAEFV